jgi:phosphoglycerol transferase MdoB-like AlkP superfamily enzyme
MWLIQTSSLWFWFGALVVAFLLSIISWNIAERTNQFSEWYEGAWRFARFCRTLLHLAVFTLPLPLFCNIVRVFMDYNHSHP